MTWRRILESYSPWTIITFLHSIIQHYVRRYLRWLCRKEISSCRNSISCFEGVYSADGAFQIPWNFLISVTEFWADQWEFSRIDVGCLRNRLADFTNILVLKYGESMSLQSIIRKKVSTTSRSRLLILTCRLRKPHRLSRWHHYIMETNSQVVGCFILALCTHTCASNRTMLHRAERFSLMGKISAAYKNTVRSTVSDTRFPRPVWIFLSGSERKSAGARRLLKRYCRFRHLPLTAVGSLYSARTVRLPSQSSKPTRTISYTISETFWSLLEIFKTE